MGNRANNRPEWRRAGGLVLDALLVIVTFGLAAWYRAARTRHSYDGNLRNEVGTGAGVLDHSAEYESELRSYVAGFALAVLLTVPPFAFVAWHGASHTTILWIVAGTAVAQIAVHLHYFLHINLSRSKRDDLQLILFSLLIVVMMVGGTLWILGNLHARMM